MQQNCYSTISENQNRQMQMELDYSCEILSTGSQSDGDGDSECYIEDLQTPHTTNTQESEYDFKELKPYPCFDVNDPLRYFLETGEITPNEYEKWKLVNEEPRHQSQTQPKARLDFGPGHNDSDDDDQNDQNDDGEGRTTTVFGNGYSVLFHGDAEPVDPWNPTPDPTPSNDRRYTVIANDGTFMLKQLTQSDPYNHKLSTSFELKLLWERYMCASSQRFQPLQDFWQENVLKIYEALQDLTADHARIRNREYERGVWFPKDTPAPPPHHTTPIETLENTFETIGRMSRCIAEDFNTPSVVDYVEEFMMSLYREIVFNALVEAHENKISDIEWDKFTEQKYAERKQQQQQQQ